MMPCLGFINKQPESLEPMERLGTERTTGLRKESASYGKVIPATLKLTKGQAIESHLALLQ